MSEPCTITTSWLERYKDLYVAASDHKYFHLIKTGVVRKEEFEVWLMQHYLFTRMFARFVASLLSKTPEGPEFGEGHGDGIEMEMVLGSIMALDTEVKFLKAKAEEWELDWSPPSSKSHPSNHKYCMFIHRLSHADVPYVISMMTLWSVASVFSLGWAMCAESPTTPCDLVEFCQRWGDDALLDFCNFLQTLVEIPLAMSPPEVVEEAESVFTELLKHQKSFMDIAVDIMEDMRKPEKEREWQERLVLEQRERQVELAGNDYHHQHCLNHTEQREEEEQEEEEEEEEDSHRKDGEITTSGYATAEVSGPAADPQHENSSKQGQLESSLTSSGTAAQD